LAVKWNVGYLCRGYQNWRKIRVELQVVMARIQQARNLWCERGNNDIGRKANITHSLGCGRHQYLLPLTWESSLLLPVSLQDTTFSAEK